MTTFTTAPDFAAAMTVKPRVRLARYRDGYGQRQADGLNTQADEWQLSFAGRTVSERDTILGFFSARNGVEAFSWTSPRGAAGRYVCSEWAASPTGPQSWTITARFARVFDCL
jgi:phage-related protein